MTFKHVNIQIKALIAGVVSRNNMQKIANTAKAMVIDRTAKGYGVPQPEGPKERLKGLSESTKKRRNRLKRQGKLSSETTPKKSNLTESRHMLDSVRAKATTGEATVYLSNSEANKKAKYQEDSGRIFMNLSKNEVNKIKKEIEQGLINDIKKKGL